MVRLVAVFCVILLHVDLTDAGVPGAVSRSAARWAVPFFFIISGYFSSTKSLSLADPKRRKALFRLSWLVLFANVIYIPYALKLGLFSTDLDVQRVALGLAASGFAFHLWFLHSLLFSNILISLAPTHRTCVNLSLCLGILVSLIGIFKHSLDIGPISGTLLNLANAVPFLAAGILLAKFRPSTTTAWSLVALGICLQLIEFFAILNTNGTGPAANKELFIGTPILSFGIASLVIFPNRNGRDGGQPKTYPAAVRLAGTIGAAYALGIYIFHIYVRIVINSTARFFGVYETQAFRGLSPVLIFIVSIILLYISFKIPTMAGKAFSLPLPMFIEKITAYLKAASAIRRLHLNGFPFIPKKLIKLAPFNREAYNKFLTEAVAWNLGNAPLICDVGANNGDFALAFQAAYPGARLHLFEPLTRHLDHLRDLKEAGSFEWTIHPYALGPRKEELEIEIPDGFEDASSLLGFSQDYLRQNPRSAKTRRETCAVRPLDELIAGEKMDCRIDLLKIDVEGFEFAVLEGATDTLRRVRNIVVEVSLLRHSERDYCPVARMVDTLEKAGLRLFRMHPTVVGQGPGNMPLEYDLYFTRSREVVL